MKTMMNPEKSAHACLELAKSLKYKEKEFILLYNGAKSKLTSQDSFFFLSLKESWQPEKQVFLN